MPARRKPKLPISEIRVEPQPRGLRSVYLIETRSRAEADDVARLFRELESQVQVQKLCEGKLVGYVVQAHQSDSLLLDEIDDVLRQTCSFVVTYRSFEPLIYRIVAELCRDTHSTLLPLPHCNICGAVDPFPNTLVSLADPAGAVLVSRNYCSGCTARVAASSHKEFVRSLLMADERDFGGFERTSLVRRSSHKRPITFRVEECKSTSDQ